MLFTITGNGSCDGLYDNQCIFIENATEQEIQAFLDEWRQSLPEDKLDMFGDIVPSKIGIEDIVAAMPSEWNAKVTDKYCSILFA